MRAVSPSTSSDPVNGLPEVLGCGENVLFGTDSRAGYGLHCSESSSVLEVREPERCLTVFLSCSNSLWISAILLWGSVSHVAAAHGGPYALLFTRRKDGSMMQGPLFKCVQREHGLGNCSVALQRAFIWRHSVQERAPRTERLSTAGFVSAGAAGDMFLCCLIRSQLLKAPAMLCLGQDVGVVRRWGDDANRN
jgi:hypothetical protein